MKNQELKMVIDADNNKCLEKFEESKAEEIKAKYEAMGKWADVGLDVNSIINPPKIMRRPSNEKCIVCDKKLFTAKERADWMCPKCEESTSKIANQFNVEDRFDIVENKDLKRWEFNPKGDWIGYLVSFSECDNKEDAIIAVWKSFKSTA